MLDLDVKHPPIYLNGYTTHTNKNDNKKLIKC